MAVRPTGARLSPLEWLERLVAFDTDSAKSNLPLIAAVAEYLQGWGVPFVQVPNAAGDKAALFATIGPGHTGGGVVLSGHTDCVPVAGQPWTSDPFTLRIADGRVHGRGAVDMKGFDALVLAAVPDFLAADLATPIHILLSYDEETTCLGVVDTIARFGRDLPMPRAAIVGEPTELTVVDAHKSVATFVTTIRGRSAHSANPRLGANAVAAAGDLVHELNLLTDEYAARGDRSGRFDPPCSTIHIGRVIGGSARNILAESCTVEWEFRGLPDLDPTEIPARVSVAAGHIVRERLNRYGPFGSLETVQDVLVPGLEPEPGSLTERLCLEITGSSATRTVPFATEAGHFRAAGVPTVVCGPGSIASAHQPDEYITLDELAAGERFMKRLSERCAAGL